MPGQRSHWRADILFARRRHLPRSVGRKIVPHYPGSGVNVPVGARGSVAGDALHLIGVVAHPEGSAVYRDEISGPLQTRFNWLTTLAERLLQQGAGRILGHASA